MKTKMARCRLHCDSLCVYFLIFTTLQVVWTIDDKLLYNTDLSSERNQDISFVFKDDSHRIHKRQTTNNNPNSTVVPQTASPNTTTIKNVTIVTTPSTPVPVVNVTQIPTIKSTVQHNLGENGTGIRKYPNSTEKPAATTPTTLVTNGTTVATKINQTVADNDEISITRFPDNKTIAEHNITKQQIDNHVYYNSTFKTDPKIGKFYYVNMTNLTGVVVHELLSKSYRRAAAVKLSFPFPFYGQMIRNVSIATGGFIYTGDFMHSWLAATQYIAPLMANFDTSLKNHSYVKYHDNGTAFTVEWENVSLQDRPKDGNFTFQATLYQNGDIAFVYPSVPILIENIQDTNHPVKVGLSDAYVIDRTVFNVRRKTIYEYHRINFTQSDIKNWTVIYLQALPTCHEHTNCSTCTQNKLNYQCTWCPLLNKCSNGQDRSKQDWLTKDCIKLQISNASMCPANTVLHQDDINAYSHQDSKNSPDANDLDLPRAVPIADKSSHMGFSSILATLVIVALVVALGIWGLYAYRNPHTTSGQMLIRYRPSQWRWRRGEARYTAATIHM